MQTVKTPGRKISVIVGLTIIMTFLVAAPALSQNIAVQENSPAMKVKYLEGSKDALLFNLRYINNSGNDFKLMVLGEGGEILFQETYSGKKLRKKIKLARLTDTDGVTFLIRPAKENHQLSCTVKVTDKIEDNTLTED